MWKTWKKEGQSAKDQRGGQQKWEKRGSERRGEHGCCEKKVCQHFYSSDLCVFLECVPAVSSGVLDVTDVSVSSSLSWCAW